MDNCHICHNFHSSQHPIDAVLLFGVIFLMLRSSGVFQENGGREGLNDGRSRVVSWKGSISTGLWYQNQFYRLNSSIHRIKHHFYCKANTEDSFQQTNSVAGTPKSHERPLSVWKYITPQSSRGQQCVQYM